MCHLYCHCPVDREDLVQEIIVQLWEASDKYNAQYKLSTWMYRIALNVAISFFRKENRRTKKMTLFDEHFINNIELNDDADELEQNIQTLYRFISNLDELNKAIALLYLDGHCYREIAGIVGISETNVATKVSRIKQILKQDFSELDSQH